ncbi:hypothetical protein FJ944_17335 [Mesorhizobium sp. B2-4-11]|nr:hypothetical protein FJ944_17335 [Mesorhizobium sp. B2-4-11]
MRPALANLPVHDGVKTSKSAVSVEEFLDHAEMLTANLLAFEARRCFALTLDGLFERQLKIWVMAHLAKAELARVARAEFVPLLYEAGFRHGLDLQTGAVGTTIEELHLLGSVVPHGDGSSLTKLRNRAPHLWRYANSFAATLSEEHAILSETIEVSDGDFARYMRAVTRFWGLADREPGAVVDVPY